MTDFDSLQTILGITFKDISHLQQALVHRSYVNEAPNNFPLRSNERLEFLGDALLGVAVAEKLYREFPDFDEGSLTKLRSSLVRTDTLARVAKTLDLGAYLYLGKGEDESGGRNKRRNLACTVEAVIGAVFVDQGFDTAREFVLRILSSEFEPAIEQKLEKDPKSKLQEAMQSQRQLTPTYKTIDSSGPDHKKLFTMQVYIDDILLGSGTGRSKRRAEQEAAKAALEYLEGEPDLD